MPPAMTLDAPPAQPAAVQAGGAAPPPPMAGVGGMLADRAGGPPGAEGGNGQIVSMWEVLEKAIQKWGQLHPSLQAFAARMVAVGKSGLQNVVDKGGGGMGGPGPRPGAPPPPPVESAKPGEMGAGAGFPG